MKKLLALVLALAMVLSLSAVAFAKEKDVTEYGIGISTKEVAKKAYTFSADSKAMQDYVIQYGKSAYLPIVTDTIVEVGGFDVDVVELISKSDLVDGLKIKVEYETGKDLIEGVSLVKKKVNNPAAIEGVDTAEPGYYYFIEMKVVKKDKSTASEDVIGTITLNKSKKSDIKSYITPSGIEVKSEDGEKLPVKVKNLEIDFSFVVSYEHAYYAHYDSGYKGSEELYVTGDDVTELEPDTYYLLKYSNDEEVEFTFGLDENEGSFTVDVSGQSKNVMYYTTTLNEDVAAANPDAKIFELNFNNVKFNRTGEFTYEGEDFEYAYQLMADGSLKKLGEFSGEEVSFKTRELGTYIFSDVELVAPSVPVEEPVVEPGVVEPAPVVNPATGGDA